jgi:Ser/Thr protein kinase RdoA (MazF antagonist)
MIRTTGLPTPEPVRVHRDRLSDDVVLELPYVDGLVAAELLGTPEGAATCGRCCGEVAAAIAGARDAPTGLRATWTSSGLLVEAARTWLASCEGVLATSQVDALETVLARAARTVDESPSQVAHGDLAPVNVLVHESAIAAVLDLDRVQLAHPLYDAAWFSWVVTFHHPDVAAHACAAFAEAAGTPARATEVSWLWPLLLLERLAQAASPGERATWTARLLTSLTGA